MSIVLMAIFIDMIGMLQHYPSYMNYLEEKHKLQKRNYHFMSLFVTRRLFLNLTQSKCKMPSEHIAFLACVASQKKRTTMEQQQFKHMRGDSNKE